MTFISFEWTEGRAYDTLIFDNLFDNIHVENAGIDTAFCKEGMFNRFTGRSGIKTYTGIDVDPSCTWSLPDGITIMVNRAWEKLWGVTINDLSDYNILKDTQLEELGILPYIKKGFAGESSFIPAASYDVQETLGKGAKRWVQAHIYPVKDEIGSILSVVLMHEDITKRRKAEEEIKKRIKELERFYDMSVGRELKMKQLKKHITKLELKLSMLSESAIRQD